jgi:hypothetical protein
MIQQRREHWWIVIALAILVMCFTPATWAAGQRIVADIGEPFEVGGEVYPSGRLSLREIGRLSPVASINEICVDGACPGIVLARETGSLPTAIRNELLFERDARSGHLVLVAVALAGQPIRRPYRFPGAPGEDAAAARPQPSPAPVLIASAE